jgi:hypothetical protein
MIVKNHTVLPQSVKHTIVLKSGGNYTWASVTPLRMQEAGVLAALEIV